MSAHATRIELSAYALGRMQDAEMQRISAHLQDCEACRQILQELEQAREFLDRVSGHVMEGHPTSEELVGYFRNELDEGTTELVRKHLAQCETCWLTDAVVDEMANIREEDRALLDRISKVSETRGALWKKIQEQQSALSDEVLHIFDLREVFAKTAASLRSLGLTQDFLFPEPVMLPGLAPVAVGIEYAAGEKGFEEERKTAEGCPFELNIFSFGESLRIHARTDDVQYRESLILVRFQESSIERASLLVLVQNGEGEYRLRPRERDIAAPVQENLQVSLEVIWPLGYLDEEQAASVAESLGALMEHPSDEIQVFLLRALGDLGVPSALDAVMKAEENGNESVRRAAQEARLKIENRSA